MSDSRRKPLSGKRLRVKLPNDTRGFPKAKVISFPSAKVWLPDSSQMGPILAKEYFPSFRPIDTLKREHLAETKLIVLPFAHSISKDASDLVRQAVADGKKLLLGDMLGERDPEGETCPAPLLADLVGQKGVQMMARDLAARLCERSAAAKLRSSILAKLGPDVPITLKRPPKAEVEVTLREKSPSEKVVFLVNWSASRARIKIGIPVPSGRYALLMHDSEQVTKASGPTLTERDLAALPVTMPALSARVLYVRAVQE